MKLKYSEGRLEELEAQPWMMLDDEVVTIALALITEAAPVPETRVMVLGVEHVSNEGLAVPRQDPVLQVVGAEQLLLGLASIPE